MEKFLAMTDEQRSCLSSIEIEEVKRRVMVEKGVKVIDDKVSKSDIDSLKEAVEKPDFNGYKLNTLNIVFKDLREAQAVADLINSSSSVVRVTEKMCNCFIDTPEYLEREHNENCKLDKVDVYSKDRYESNKESIERNYYLDNAFLSISSRDDSSQRYSISKSIDEKIVTSRRNIALYKMYLRIVNSYLEYTDNDVQKALEKTKDAYNIPDFIYTKIEKELMSK